MKKTYKLEDLDCASCAAKMEDALNKMPEVNIAAISFMRQELILDAADEGFDATVKKPQKAMRRIEPDVRILV